MFKLWTGFKNYHKTKILVGYPTLNPDGRFLKSLSKFIKQARKKYNIEVLPIVGKQLVDAQNSIARYFIYNTNCDYLLILESDHYGHKVEMLDALVNKDVEVASINYYSRHFPYYSCLMRELPDRGQDARFAGLGYSQGFELCDLSGFAMMLIKRSVFKKLDKPYFRLNKFGGPGSYATDIEFCDRLKEYGIQIWGCFDYCLAHRDITPENRMEKLLEGMKVSRENDIIEKFNLIRRRREYELASRNTVINNH